MLENNARLGHVHTSNLIKFFSIIINNVMRLNKLTEREMELMKVSLSDRSLSQCENRNELRADLLKNMLLVIFS